ncbi:hypothetical protein ScPMuIL_005716 [Solemya velum]
MIRYLVAILLLGSTFAEIPERTKRSSICYGDLGCFSTSGAFTDFPNRILSLLPRSPQQLDVRFRFYNRNNRNTSTLLDVDNGGTITASGFDPQKKTKFVIHGFIDGGQSLWMLRMKDELLIHGDYNVILVDWGKGSKLPYTQATANTRVVGALTAKLIKQLQTALRLRPEDVHLIGHSLGAHICGYAGERVQSLGRITGMDPAEPYFQYTDRTVRLDPTDALFVDVIHTNGESMLNLGYGMLQPCGHVDYFPNGGQVQPGCSSGQINDLDQGLYEGMKWVVACNHLRSYDYFTESINSACPFAGYKCETYDRMKAGACVPCSGSSCGYMGMHADRVKPPSGTSLVKYYLLTGDARPYCKYHMKLSITTPSSSSRERGQLYAKVIGSARNIYFESGQTYSYIFVSSADIGTVSRVQLRWTHKGTITNPFSLNILNLRTPTIQISRINIVEGESKRSSQFCMTTDDSRSLPNKQQKIFDHAC